MPVAGTIDVEELRDRVQAAADRYGVTSVSILAVKPSR